MRVRAVAPCDLLERDGRVLALYAESLVELSPVTHVIIDATTDWTDVDDVTAELLAAFGVPPEGSPETVVGSMVAELLTHGVLEEEHDAAAEAEPAASPAGDT